MKRTIRLVAAIAFVSLAFQVRVFANPKGVKPPRPAGGKPSAAAKPPKSIHGTATAPTAGGATTKHAPKNATMPARTVAPTNPIATKIARNPKLATKVASRLPAGMTLAQASTGFRNQGQFLAAVNVSRNLGIDFAKLQTAMTGQTVTVNPKTHDIVTTPTGEAPLSLGRAIQTLKPGADADGAINSANAQTSAMVGSSSRKTHAGN